MFIKWINLKVLFIYICILPFCHLFSAVCWNFLAFIHHCRLLKILSQVGCFFTAVNTAVFLWHFSRIKHHKFSDSHGRCCSDDLLDSCTSSIMSHSDISEEQTITILQGQNKFITLHCVKTQMTIIWRQKVVFHNMIYEMFQIIKDSKTHLFFSMYKNQLCAPKVPITIQLFCLSYVLVFM